MPKKDEESHIRRTWSVGVGGRSLPQPHTGGDHKYARRTRLIVAHKISCITNPELLYDIFSLYFFTTVHVI